MVILPRTDLCFYANSPTFNKANAKEGQIGGDEIQANALISIHNNNESSILVNISASNKAEYLIEN